MTIGVHRLPDGGVRLDLPHQRRPGEGWAVYLSPESVGHPGAWALALTTFQQAITEER